MDSYWVELLGAETRFIGRRYRTRIVTAGRGAPLLLLHGTGGHIENYARNIPAYARHFRVVALDFRWHGCSDTRDFVPEILPALVEQVRALAGELGFARYSLEGQSLGGWVALLLAHDHPAEVEKLVLTTPMGYRPDPARLDWRPPDPAALRESSLAVLRDPSRENVRLRLERILADPAALTEEAVAVRHRLYNDPALNAAQQAFIASYLGGPAPRRHEWNDATLAEISRPTLVYWGDHNPMPPAVGRHIAAQIPAGQFHCAGNTGHWAQFENAEEHNSVVLRFLTGDPALAPSAPGADGWRALDGDVR